jgi:hypothetical protein
MGREEEEIERRMGVEEEGEEMENIKSFDEKANRFNIQKSENKG